MSSSGKVYLVGAGPGDPELLTLKGRRVLGLADSVLFDHLANDALLELAPDAAERLYVGKKKATHSYKQEEIAAMMIERARAGRTVVRLKGGDPFIFGRGGEEVEALAEAGIAYEVVPGVTSPLGIAAYTGVPLTHREHTSVVTFVTGHSVEGIDWSKVGASETLVIFMGLHFIAEITRELLASGRSPDTPAMAVRWGTRPDQHTVVGTLAGLPGLILEHRLTPPATVIIGDVVLLREKLNWYEKLPLFGKRIVVTRAREQAGELTAKLRALGADVVELPVIALRPLDDYTDLDRAIAALSTYDWLIFTSTNAVDFFLQRLSHSGTDLRSLRARICAIGPATRAAVESLHIKVDLVPSDAIAEGIAAAFGHLSMKGAKVLLPRAAAAREVVPDALRAMGAQVDVVDAYRNMIPETAAQRAGEIFGGSSKPHWVTFTSSSTVKNLLAVAGAAALKGVRIASIGRVTSKTAEAHGLTVDCEAKAASMDGLIEAILHHS
ncbi:MAG: uroporphyrinogen-III C-methyltransferase [Bryobacteraceae bacterium]